MRTNFKQQLKIGQLGESLIANWLRAQGWYILPAYEKQIDNGKGPRLFTPNGQLISPDILAMKPDSKICWIEAKHKTNFTWRYMPPGPRWETGIDYRHFKHYLEVSKQLPFNVWLFFLHASCEPRSGDKKAGCPNVCPTGLYGEKLSVLGDIDKRQIRGDKTYHKGKENLMVYWGIEQLRKLADLEEVTEHGGIAA